MNKKMFLVSAALLASGCFNMTVKMDVKPDGTGKREILLSGPTDNDMFIAGMADSLAEVSKADTLIRETKGDTVYYTIRNESADFTAGDKPLITHQGNKWVFGMEEEGSGETDETTKSLFEGFTFRLEVTLPGKIISHNADTKKGNTLIWERPMYDFNVQGLSAKAEYEPGSAGGGFNWGLIGGIICCLLIIVIIVVVVVVIVSRKKK